MRHIVAILALLIALIPSLAHAKRAAPPKPAPVIHEGVRYIAPNDSGRRAYVQAWDIKAGQMLWEATVFETAIDPSLEEDVQSVFIVKLRVNDGRLVAIDEQDRAYAVDLKTHAVTRLRP